MTGQQPHESFPDDVNALFSQLDDISVESGTQDVDVELYTLQDQAEEVRIQSEVLHSLAAKSNGYAVMRDALGDRVGKEDLQEVAIHTSEQLRQVGLGKLARPGFAVLSSVAQLARFEQETAMMGMVDETDLREYQAQVLASNDFSPEDKAALLDYMRETYPDAALDTTDLDVAAQALAEQQQRDEQYTIDRQRRHQARQLITEMTREYLSSRHVDPNDPLLSELIYGMTTVTSLRLQGTEHVPSGVFIGEQIAGLRLDSKVIEEINDAVVAQLKSQ